MDRYGLKLMYNVFVRLNSKSVSILHPWSRFKSFCNSVMSLKVVIVLRHWVSSTNRNSIEDRMCSGRSSIYVKNNKGHRMLPCRTPVDKTGRNSKYLLLILIGLSLLCF